MYETARKIADAYSDKSIANKSETDYSALDIIATKDDIIVQIISKTGTVYLDTSKSYASDYSNKITDFDPSYINSGYYTVGTFFDTFESEALTVLTPITSGLTIRGYVAIHMSLDDVYSKRESLLKILHIVEIVILLLTLSLIVMMHFWVFRPVKVITDGAQQIAAGMYENKIVVNQQDEMGYLAETLNYMAAEMNEMNENQHKFISNVSHDFRSPLTSIKGYVEAIKDKVVPYEMQDKYLDIILAETQRLTKLTSELLSLDNIDNRMKKMIYTDFDINHLIRDTALSFEITCLNKNITLNLALEGNELMVNADYSKIQQVMYNLIDNALKFSNKHSSID